MIHRLALLAATLASILFSSAALAEFPLVYTWFATNSNGSPLTCFRDSAGNCKKYDSAEAACTDYSNYGPAIPSNFMVRLAVSSFGVINPPNSILQCSGCHNANAACMPPFSPGSTGIAAAQQGSTAGCPDNSNPPVGSSCDCKDGYLETGEKCDGAKNNGRRCPNCGNPVNPANGNKVERQLIYQGLNGFELSLIFNAFDESTPRFAIHWRDSFHSRVVVQGANVIVYRPDGRALQFTPNGGAWVSDADTADRLVQTSSPAGWEFQAAEGDVVETYDDAGKLLTIRSRSGLTQTLTYSDGIGGAALDANGNPLVTLPAGLLIRVSDAFGRVLAFDYNTASRVVRVTDPAGGIYRFTYVDQEKLTAITFPDNKVLTYVYNEPANTGGANLPDVITGIVDENGGRFATFKYDAQHRAVSTEHAGTTLRYLLTYSPGSTAVTDPLNTARTYNFSTVLGAFNNTGITGAVCPGCGPAAQSFDANGNVASRTDWNGNRSNYTYDLARNLEASRTEGLTAGGATTPQTRTISTTWHAIFRLPAQMAEPLRITTYTYDADGSQCGARGALCSKSVQATTDADGSQGFSAIASGTPRTWTYTYNASGFVLTVDGPRTDVSDLTTYTYYANNDADFGKRGNVATVTNALGHVTSITSYNAHGQPLAIVDPNGLTTTLAYDARQRLTSRTVGTEVTSYEYDGVGQLTKVTLPDTSFLTYTYDGAHRLTGMQDNLGNHIAYTLDAMGNRTLEQVFDPANSLAQTRSRVYSSLNRLFQELGASSQTTEYGYDDQGNVTSVKDPLNQTTSNQYDALNRLKQATDPNFGVTQYAYNGLDALTSVTDPRSLVTGYTMDGLGNLTQQVSPDTGNTVSTYDSAGNLFTQTDAKGQVTTYAYDTLNRVTLITFQDGSKQAYAYDQGANAVGRLSSITETNSANQQTNLIQYAYEPHGRVTSETRTVGGIAYVLGYSYDSSGRLSGLTYPSGRTVTYGFDALGRVNQVTTTKDAQSQVVVQNVQYQPFGGVKSFTLGNGQIYARSIDQDGRIASYTLGAANFAVSFDAASRITGIAESGNPPNTNTYGYDLLDRLTSAVLPSSSFGYGYDAVGNRLAKNVGANSDTYTYSGTSNRIATVSPASGPARSFIFDANGSTTDDGLNTYAYDTRGRMVQAANTAGTSTYQVNALGQRIRKTNGSGDTVFHYDTRGRLIAETDPAGALKRELFYLGDIPVAVLQ